MCAALTNKDAFDSGSTSRTGLSGAVVHPLGGLRALVQLLFLASGQLAYALSIELCGGGGHGVSLGPDTTTRSAN